MNLLSRYLKNCSIISFHLKKDFPLFYLCLYLIRLIHLYAIVLYVFSDLNFTIYYSIQFSHAIILIIQSYIHIYITIYFNRPTEKFVIQGCIVIV